MVGSVKTRGQSISCAREVGRRRLLPGSCWRGRMRRWLAGMLMAALCSQGWAAGKKAIRVAAAGADYRTIQEAVAAAPQGGAVIRIAPGTYREVVHVDKPGIEMRGEGNDPAKVVLVY